MVSVSVPPIPFAAAACPRGRPTEDPATAKQGNKSAKADDPNEKTIATNRKARHEYEVLDSLECGIVLVGSEVKSLRDGRMSIDEAYGRMHQDEVFLVGCNIEEYPNATHVQHEPKRWRKLLMHRREIHKFAAQAYEKNLTLVPLKMYFKQGRAKVLMGICRGKKLFDKRESLKKKNAQRDMARALKER